MAAVPIKVAIVEDQPQTREGLAILIGSTPGFQTVGVRVDGGRRQHVAQDQPAVVLCDIELPGMSGIDGVRELIARCPNVQILMLTVFADNDHVFEAICAGASGYLLKDTPPARLLEAIAELHSGGAPMSPEIARKVVAMFARVAPPSQATHQLSARELEILKLLAEGHSYKTAASELHLSLDTIRFHIRHIYEKLHVHSKSEAVILALRQGIVR
ncbi:MAG: response regulator transcription factor [Planctomycetota bacterium]